MKYAIFSDDFLSYFRLDDNGETLVLTDTRGYTRAVKLLPYDERPQGKWNVTDETDEFYGRVYTCTHCGKEMLGCGCRNFCTWCGAAMQR